MKQKPLVFALILLLGLFGENVTAAAVYTYNNFGQTGDLYNNYGNWIGDRSPDEDSVITNLIGVSFEASVTGTLDSITAAIWGPGNGYTTESNFSLSLYTNDGGVEGDKIWSQTYSYDDIYCCFDSGNGVTDFSIDNGVVLNANQSYWLVAETPLDVAGSFSWFSTNTGATGDFHMEMYDEATGSTYLSSYLHNSSSRAFSISVETVPLPAAFWLFTSSLASLVLFRASGGKRETV